LQGRGGAAPLFTQRIIAMIDLSKVKKLKQTDLPPTLQIFEQAGGVAFAGHFHDFIFIVTQDKDGQTELSLTSKDPTKRPSNEALMAFLYTCFAGENISVSETERPSRRVRHLVLRQRKIHA
jgi:hypothetical protein